MKKTYLFFIALITVFGLQAQYIYNDFDANQNETFLGWPNAPTVVTNPDVSGINTSAHVAEWMRSPEQWAHVYCEIPGTIDFTTGTVFQLKAHLPIACQVLFKLEGAGGENTELSTDVTAVNEWTQLSFDFAGAASGVYNKIVIFFDFSSTTDNTFYFDDVTGPEYGGGSTGDQVDLPVTFDDENVNYQLTDFGGNVSEIVVDPTDETNMVAKSIKTEGAETWAGTTVGGAAGFANPVPFTETYTTMAVEVWSPDAGIPVRLKVEDSDDVTITCETEAMTTVAESWETLLFDFSNEAEGTAKLDLTMDYNKASIFFDFNTTGADKTYYWDNMIFVDPTGILNNEILSTKVYPNPATDVLYLENAQDFQVVTIYSITGKMVYQSDAVSNSINLSDFTPGMYSLQANGIDGKNYQARFIVK